MLALFLFLPLFTMAQAPVLENATAQFEKRIDQQYGFLEKQYPEMRWPTADITFNDFLNNSTLNYSDQKGLRNKISAYCEAVTESYQSKVVKTYRLPASGNYFSQSCTLTNMQLQGNSVVFDQTNIGYVDKFVLLQHHTSLGSLLKSPYFSMLQEMQKDQSAYERSFFGSLGLSERYNYILTQIAVLLAFGLFLLKIFKFLR